MLCVSVEPAVIEMPRVRILNENFDTPNRQFPVGTGIQLTCQGEIGSDPSKVSIYNLHIYNREVSHCSQNMAPKYKCMNPTGSVLFGTLTAVVIKENEISKGKETLFSDS